MDHEYQFFVTTTKPHQPDGGERGLIRRLVMRNFFDRKGNASQKKRQEQNSVNTVTAAKQLKNRFRVSTAGVDKREMKSKRLKSKSGTPEVQHHEVKTGNTDLELAKVAQSAKDELSTERSRRKSLGERPIRNTVNTTGEKEGIIIFRDNPSSNRCDPFDVLPVPGTPQLDTLLKLFNSGTKSNSIAVNPNHTWWPFISSDAGLLHATLATWALFGVIVKGLRDLRVEMLRHKNEVIREIKLKINMRSDNICDELVGTVLTLANLENLLGSYGVAQLHIMALKRMVDARGGLFAFGHNDGLLRGIIWVDFHTAAALHNPPSFPHIRLDPDTPLLPERLLEEAAYTSPTSLLQLSTAGIDCFNIFYRLHRLSLAASSQWIGHVDCLTLSTLLYDIEFIVLSVPDYSQTFIEFDLNAKNQPGENYQCQKRMADAASVTEGLLAATQIFIYAALRDLPPSMKIFDILLNRLRVAIERAGVSVIDVWRRENNVMMLVWVLVVAYSVAPTGQWRARWVSQLWDLMKDLNYLHRADLEAALKRVAWVDTYFSNVLDGLWQELLQLRKANTKSMHATAIACLDSQAIDLIGLDPYIWNVEVEAGYEENYLQSPMYFEEGGWTVNKWCV